MQAGRCTLEKLQTDSCRISSVDFTVPRGCRSVEAISQKSESSGDCLSFMFWILEHDKSSLKFFFYLSEHSCRMGESLVDLLCHSSHVCVSKHELNSLHFHCFIDHWIIGQSFFFFLNRHQTVLKLSSQQSPTIFIMSYKTLDLLLRGPCQIKIRPLGWAYPANGCYFHKHRCPCSEYLLLSDKWCCVLLSEP